MPDARPRGLQAKSLVYVHGVDAGDDKDGLKRDWDIALFERDMGSVSSMAYWADIPDRRAEDVNLRTASDEELASALVEPHSSIADRQAAIDFGRSYLREAVAAEAYRSALKGRLIDPTRPIPRWLRKRAMWLITKILVEDAHAYFFDTEKQDAIRGRLRTRLTASERPTLIAAHSLGSFVAYDVLHEPAFASPLAAFITFGSHLGVRAVQDHVTQPLAVPEPARSAWHNFLDPRDPFPLGELLRPHYTPHDVEDSWVDNLADDNHGAVGYLNTRELGKAVRGSMVAA